MLASLKGPSTFEARLRNALHAKSVHREDVTGLALTVVRILVGTGHRGDIDDVEVRTAESQAGRRVHRKPDDTVDDTARIEADQPPRVDLATPEIAFGVHRRAIGQ